MTSYRVITPNGHGGGNTYRDHIVNPTTDREDAYAIAGRIPGAYVQASDNGVTGWGVDMLTDSEVDDLVSANDPTLYAEYYAPAATPRTPRYVQVNIGRNIGDEPMPDERWVSFQDDIAMAIVNATAGTLPNVNVHTGEGFWNDERTGELLSEESAYLSTFADVDLFALRKTLATLKRQYQQDAIALIAGSDLI